MTTYGNCYGKDKFCEYVSHPLTYYRRTASRQNVKK
jgi:DNA primase large subunit